MAETLTDDSVEVHNFVKVGPCRRSCVTTVACRQGHESQHHLPPLEPLSAVLLLKQAAYPEQAAASGLWWPLMKWPRVCTMRSLQEAHTVTFLRGRARVMPHTRSLRSRLQHFFIRWPQHDCQIPNSVRKQFIAG